MRERVASGEEGGGRGQRDELDAVETKTRVKTKARVERAWRGVRVRGAGVCERRVGEEVGEGLWRGE